MKCVKTVSEVKTEWHWNFLYTKGSYRWHYCA